jgi:hypothetical protein
MSQRIYVVGLAVAIAAALMSGGCGSGAPAPRTSASMISAPLVVANATLGSARFFPAFIHSKGFGSPHPSVIDNGGDPAGYVRGTRWRNWGASTASGKGLGSAFKPQGGYYQEPVVVKLRAERLGDCNGRPGYHRLLFRKQRRPHGKFGGWRSWWPSPHDDLCGYSGIPR